MSKKPLRHKDVKFFLKLVALVLSFLGVSVYTENVVEASICGDLSSKVFDYNRWVVCEQYRLADKPFPFMNGGFPSEKKVKNEVVKAADAL